MKSSFISTTVLIFFLKVIFDRGRTSCWGLVHASSACCTEPWPSRSQELGTQLGFSHVDGRAPGPWAGTAASQEVGTRLDWKPGPQCEMGLPQPASQPLSRTRLQLCWFSTFHLEVIFRRRKKMLSKYTKESQFFDVSFLCNYSKVIKTRKLNTLICRHSHFITCPNNIPLSGLKSSRGS